MKKVRYTGPARPPIVVPAANAVSDAQGLIEVDDDTAAALISQDTWEPVSAAKTSKENI